MTDTTWMHPRKPRDGHTATPGREERFARDVLHDPDHPTFQPRPYYTVTYCAHCDHRIVPHIRIVLTLPT